MTEEYKTHLLQSLASLREKLFGRRDPANVMPEEKYLLLLGEAVQALVLDSKPKE